MRRFTPNFSQQINLTAVLILALLVCAPTAAAEPSPALMVGNSTPTRTWA